MLPTGFHIKKDLFESVKTIKVKSVVSASPLSQKHNSMAEGETILQLQRSPLAVATKHT